jgi:flagellar basal-body rod protein FlgC
VDNAITIAMTGLRASQLQMQAATANLANARTTVGVEGGPYRRRIVQRSELPNGGVRAEMTADPADPVRTFDPSHPHADADGFVLMPPVQPVEELLSLARAGHTHRLCATLLGVSLRTRGECLDLLA